ncbi:MAG TPA: hypothetical protein VIV60_02380 [Polyangiaceae bacterium]
MNHQSCIDIRSQRGTAVFEGVIVFAVLTAALAAGVYLQRNFVANLTRTQEARFAAWHKGMSGCNRSPELGRRALSMLRDDGSHHPNPGAHGRAALSVDEPATLIKKAVGSGGQVAVPCDEVMRLDESELKRIQISMERALLPSL